MLYSLDVDSGATSEIGVIGQGEYVSDLAIPAAAHRLRGPVLETTLPLGLGMRI